MKIELHNDQINDILTLLTLKSAELAVKAQKSKREKTRFRCEASSDYYSDLRKHIEKQRNGAGA